MMAEMRAKLQALLAGEEVELSKELAEALRWRARGDMEPHPASHAQDGAALPHAA